MPEVTNKVEFGLSNVVISPFTFDEATGTYTYTAPKRIYGAVSLQLDAQGGSTTDYADNGVYFETTENDGYSGNAVFKNLPEWFFTDILGMKKDINGVLVEDGIVLPKPFAMGFEINGDASNRRVWLYNVNCSRPSEATQTRGETLTTNSKTLNINARARVTDDKLIKAAIVPNTTNQTIYTSFLTTVYEPTYA